MAGREAVLSPFINGGAYMNRRVSEGIEARKKYFSLAVLDKEGKPVSKAGFSLKQKEHEFKYGANLFMLDEIPDSGKNEEYKRLFKEGFNLATLPFYWKDLEPEEGKPRYFKDAPKLYRRPAPELCLDWCEANGITPKAHCLVYDPWSPKWLKDRTVPEIKEAYLKRFSELSQNFGKRIRGWEVINETLCGNGTNNTAFYTEPDLVEWSFTQAERYFTANELIINECHPHVWESFNYTRGEYYMQLERLLSLGARIDAIGMQYHMFYREKDELSKTKLSYDPYRMYDLLDTYSRFGKPLQITELTIPCYRENAEDEAIQAEIIKNIYKMWFSCPAIEAVIYWNLMDGYAAFAEAGSEQGENYYHGGLVRYDGTPKPAYNAIRDMFKNEYVSNEKGETNAEGYADLKIFCGDYELTVENGGETKKIPLKFASNGKKRIEIIL